jgi:hypothetical protein
MLADGVLVLAAAFLAGVIVDQAYEAIRPAPPPVASAALAADPLDVSRLSALGLDLDRRGDPRGAALMTFAGTRGWRDPKAQAWLLQRALREARWDDALRHADALLRIDGAGVYRPTLFRILDLAASDPGGRPALVARLAQAPQWRQSWLEQLGAATAAGWSGRAQTPGTALDAASAGAVLLGVASGPTPPLPSEYRTFVATLVQHGDEAGALADWRLFAHRPDTGAALRDPDFTVGSDGTDFTWSAAAGPGASSEVVQRVEDAPAALRIDYDGASMPELPAQMLVLPPGRYRLSWRERLAGDPRLAWQVRCVAPTSAILGSWPVSVAASWRARSETFAEPAGCRAQRLELTPLPGERRSEVTAWFAQVRLSPG